RPAGPRRTGDLRCRPLPGEPDPGRNPRRPCARRTRGGPRSRPRPSRRHPLRPAEPAWRHPSRDQNCPSGTQPILRLYSESGNLSRPAVIKLKPYLEGCHTTESLVTRLDICDNRTTRLAPRAAGPPGPRRPDLAGARRRRNPRMGSRRTVRIPSTACIFPTELVATTVVLYKNPWRDRATDPR